MKNEIYADYDEKFIKSTIVYAFEDNGSLYFSEDTLPKNRVSKLELSNLFKKGLLVNFNDVLYSPIKLLKNAISNEYNVVIVDGSNSYTFTSEDNELYPLSPTYSPTTRVLTIPDQEGVLYFKNSETVAMNPGKQTALTIGPENVTITAKPDEGYMFDPEATLVWVFDTLSEVEPTAATFNDGTGVITIPSKTGCVYKIDGSIAESGTQDPINKDVDVVVTVEADLGYKLKENSTISWTFNWSD